MHEAGFCATPTRLRELRLEAVALQAAAGRLQRAWARSVQTRVHTVLAQMRRACVSIQRMARGALVRWPLAASSWEGHDEAGPLPPHWDWSYDRTTGERVFYHIHGGQSPVVESACGALSGLSFPPHWPPTSLQRQREMRGLPGSIPTIRAPAPTLIADCSSDDGSEFGAAFGYGDSGALSDCEFFADEW